MIVPGTGPAHVPVPASRPPAIGAASFRVPEPVPNGMPVAAGMSGMGAAAGTMRAASVGTSLLLFQEAAGDEREDRDAAERGRMLLAALRELQRALLSGGGGAAAASRLGALLELPTVGRDPRLRELLRSIALRARIELARMPALAGCRNGSRPAPARPDP